jgi:hypothetical protein
VAAMAAQIPRWGVARQPTEERVAGMVQQIARWEAHAREAKAREMCEQQERETEEERRRKRGKRFAPPPPG